MENLKISGRAGLTFSQASLQDFVDCRRLFWLRYLQQLSWPALESEPVIEAERLLEQGARFHRLVHQWILGIDQGRLAGSIHDEDLQRWWEHFHLSVETSGLSLLKDGSIYLFPEISLTATLIGYPIIAKCDLVAVLPTGKVMVFDWKTSRKKPGRSKLAGRLQTRIYPYLLVRAGKYLNDGAPILPDSIQMIYWFSDFPTEVEIFDYSEMDHRRNEEYISALIEEIINLEDEAFIKTERLDRCKFCVYRSLCERGAIAGNLTDISDEIYMIEPDQLLADFEHLPEIPL